MDLKKLQRDPAAFRQSLKIDANGESVLLGSRLEPWQDGDFRSLDPAWKRLAGFGSDECKSRAWLERPRGHSKTTDIATMVTWALFASRRPIRGIVAAADADQARLLRDAVRSLTQLTPWLGKVLKVSRDRIENLHTHSQLQIIASDAASSYGLLADFVVCDELTHWAKDDLWTSLLSTAAKRRHCALIVISNAGVLDTWQHQLREQIRVDQDWHFSRLDGPQASWISEKQLQEQIRLLPEVSYRRLWLNEWVDADGCAALTPGEIERSIATEVHGDAQPGWQYCLGVDLGLKRDHSAIVVVGKHVGAISEREIKPRLSSQQTTLVEAGVLQPPESEFEETVDEATGQMIVCEVQTWQPDGNCVCITDVERAILELDLRYRFTTVAYDPWQASYLAERLGDAGLSLMDVPFSGPNLQAMCSEMLQSFRENKIQLCRDGSLLRDLRRMRVVEKSYGSRLDFARTAEGHGDGATALAIGLLAAKQLSSATAGRVEGELVCYP